MLYHVIMSGSHVTLYLSLIIVLTGKKFTWPYAVSLCTRKDEHGYMKGSFFPLYKTKRRSECLLPNLCIIVVFMYWIRVMCCYYNLLLSGYTE